MDNIRPCPLSVYSNNNNAHFSLQQSPHSQLTEMYTSTNAKDEEDVRINPQKYSQGNRDVPKCKSSINGCENSPKRLFLFQRTNRLNLNKALYTSCRSKGNCNKKTGNEPISRTKVAINDKPIVRGARRKSTETRTSVERRSNDYRISANGEKNSAGYTDPSWGIISTSTTETFRNYEGRVKKCMERLSSKKGNKPTTMHLYQRYQNPSILQWLERKEKEKRREQQRQKSQERTKHVTQKWDHVGRKKRAELAKLAFDTWLDSKSRRTEARKNVESVSTKAKSAIITAVDRKEAANLKGLFQPFSNDSETPQDTDNIESITSAEKSQSIPLTTCNHEEILKNSSGKRGVECQQIISRSESHDACFVLEEVLQPTACEIKQTTFTDCQSADENTVQPFDIFESTEVSAVVEKCHHELQTVQDLTATKLTHKQWLRQNFLQARYSEQARWETHEHVALAENVRPTFLQSWNRLLKKTIPEIYRQKWLTAENVSSSLQVCSISDPRGSTNSTEQNGVRNRRRRISFKLPATLLDPSCPTGDVFDYVIGKSRWKYQPKVFEKANSLSPESLLVNAVVEKTPDYAETQIYMQTL